MVPRLEGGSLPPPGCHLQLPALLLPCPILLPLFTSRSELRPEGIIAPRGPHQVGVVPVPSCPTLAALGIF